MMTISEFYKAQLESLNLNVNDKGVISFFADGQFYPQSIPQCNDRVLVLPTPEILKNPDWTQYVAYHPLSENVVRKESAVFKFITKNVYLTVNNLIGNLITEMVDICADRSKQAKLSPKQNGFLTCFTDADPKSYENWQKIEAKVGKDKWYAKFVTLRERPLNGESYIRTTTVTFPLYAEIMDLINSKAKEFTLFGVKIRKKDLLGYKALFEFILPNIAEPNKAYSYGTRSMLAPSYHALMTSFVNVMSDIQKVTRVLKMDTASLKWKAELEDLEKYRGLIPPLDGNEGEVTEQERRQTANQIQVPNTPVQPVGVATTPLPATQPTAQPAATQTTQPKGMISMSQLIPPAVQPQVPAGYQYNQFGQLVPTQQQVAYTQPIPQPVQPIGGPVVQGAVVPMNNQVYPIPGQPVVQQPIYQQPVQQYQQPTGRNALRLAQQQAAYNSNMQMMQQQQYAMQQQMYNPASPYGMTAQQPVAYTQPVNPAFNQFYNQPVNNGFGRLL